MSSPEHHPATRDRAATLALAATIFLTIIKVGAGLASHSVGVLSEGIHSFLDLISASLAFYAIREAGKPADDDHPFGHGKLETLSSLFESLLLVAAAVLISVEAVNHFRQPEAIVHADLAIGVTLVSVLVSLYVYRHNLHASGVTDSSALEVNALHFLSDVVASVGVLIALVLMRLTGWLWLDPLVASLVALYIVSISVNQVKRAVGELSDIQLPQQEQDRIREITLGFSDRMIEMHDLRTRKGGSTRHVDFHLVVCGARTVQDSHSLCDDIEGAILRELPSASVTIHVEPCEFEKTGCNRTCPIRRKSAP